MQSRVGWSVLLETGPRTEHIEASAKARFADHERPRCLPRRKALWQPVRSQKHVLGFGTAILTGKIDVVEGVRVG